MTNFTDNEYTQQIDKTTFSYIVFGDQSRYFAGTWIRLIQIYRMEIFDDNRDFMWFANANCGASTMIEPFRVGADQLMS